MQKVLIIGAGGIGTSVAREIVSTGGRAFLAGRSEEKLRKTAADLNCEYGIVEATDAASVDSCGDTAFEVLEGLTGIVNCVGSILLKPAHLTSSDEWHETITANLTTAFHCVRTAGRLLRSSGGSVVLLSSAAIAS